MEIVWYGHSCFRFIERGMASVVTDPFDSDVVGFEPLKLRADIVTVSHDAPYRGMQNREIKQISKKPFSVRIGVCNSTP